MSYPVTVSLLDQERQLQEEKILERREQIAAHVTGILAEPLIKRIFQDLEESLKEIFRKDVVLVDRIIPWERVQEAALKINPECAPLRVAKKLQVEINRVLVHFVMKPENSSVCFTVKWIEGESTPNLIIQIKRRFT